MPSRTKKVFFRDYVFNVFEEVYEPAEDSFLFAENLPVGEDDYVLDMGTGCGILGIIAASKAAMVISIDINPHAVRCAQENVKLNNITDKLFLAQGDLFTPLRTEESFDLILFNAPYLPVNHEKDDPWLGRAWAGGANGRQVIDRFIPESVKHLKQDGCVLLMQSTLSNADETMRQFKRYDLRTEILAELALPLFETIVLIKAEC